MAMTGYLHRSWWILLLYGVIAVIFGVMALINPLTAGVALAWAFGIMALAEGVISVAALFDRDSSLSRGWLLLYAVASLLFGVLTLINPAATAEVLILFLAAWLVIGGVFRIVFAVRVRKAIRGEWLIALSGLLAILLGALFIASPVAGLVVTTLWIGAIALIYGALQIVAAFRVRRLENTLR
ncbi:putative transmembrane protein [Alcanivorax sp. S71-1-4]|uniref:HdeD family acid-resistance protein n=1 Tax=Alcanivorax sp. S71-1-4 TaxID=1177159 RepID=UPI001356D55E|nr:HdeD family acid-resistance protein [Alcanivorax sp. S71-1-4]KAF0808696.1 putative transmembrane protein [Alcanivorax sp. S71-1-4]